MAVDQSHVVNVHTDVGLAAAQERNAEPSQATPPATSAARPKSRFAVLAPEDATNPYTPANAPPIASQYVGALALSASATRQPPRTVTVEPLTARPEQLSMEA